MTVRVPHEIDLRWFPGIPRGTKQFDLGKHIERRISHISAGKGTFSIIASTPNARDFRHVEVAVLTDVSD